MAKTGVACTPELLHQVRNLMRLQHYSIHTERSYVDWIRRFIHFHQMRSRADFAGGARPRLKLGLCPTLLIALRHPI